MSKEEVTTYYVVCDYCSKKEANSSGNYKIRRVKGWYTLYDQNPNEAVDLCGSECLEEYAELRKQNIISKATLHV